jgi:hypothetical protein
MDFDGYLRYALTESATAERSWCEASLNAVFGGGMVHDVVFPAYLAEIDTM